MLKLRLSTWRKRRERPSSCLSKRRKERKLERNLRDSSSKSSRELKQDMRSLSRSSKRSLSSKKQERQSSNRRRLKPEKSFKKSFNRKRKCYARPKVSRRGSSFLSNRLRIK